LGYKKRALGKFYKTSPTGGSSHAKGIVLEKVCLDSLDLAGVLVEGYESRESGYALE